MGILGFKPLLPQTQVKDFISHWAGKVFRVDAANLMVKCGREHAEEFEVGNYKPAVAAFQRIIKFMRARGADLLMIFDGSESPY